MNQLRLALASFLSVLLLASCNIDPFCVENCDDEGDGGGDAGDDGGIDGGTDADADGDADGDGDGDGDADGDADADDGCVEGAEEECNGRDDNCDGQIDEGFDFQTDQRHCGGCNQPCLLDHAFSECVGGSCRIDVCDVCFHDIDGDASTGCEYACCQTTSPQVEGSCEQGEGDEQVDCCDGLDNDCDGEIDEDHDLTNDPHNCGGCAATCEGDDCPFVCDYPLGIPGCADGECYLAGCVEGHYDVDGRDENGCEYACTPNPDTDGEEICNSRDDDCDGEVDEEFPGMGEACGESEGLCEQGTNACVGGHVVCEGEVLPSPEVCDGADNDCDGEIDEDDPVVGGGCGTEQGECHRGVWECTGGALVCAGETAPATEVCDGLDNDCDGVPDDGVPDDGPCGTDEGECSQGTRVCLGGRFVCDGSVGPVPESCDGLDNDCDGSIDEDLVRDCSNACGIGEEHCDGGAWVGCTARVAAPEECDGVDNDCDGLTDEDDAGGPLTEACTVGTCGGTRTCTGPFTWSDCSVTITEETCNGVDDDCDDQIDEGPAPGEPLTRSCLHACGPGVQTCQADGTWGACVGPREIAPEECDGIDNDCDGDIDEDDTGATLTRECSFLLCTGTETCTAPFTWTGCTAVAGTEVCNGVDDDCDGDIDEDATGAPLRRSCSTACGPGEEVCEAGGVWGACDAPVPGAETCNGEDDDCDGLVDEDATGARITRSCSTVCGSGTETCVGPSSWSPCTAPEPDTEVCNGVDDDCDGTVDNVVPPPNTISSCGDCATDCRALFPNAAVRCNAGTCEFIACAAGWFDIDGEPGCEYECTVTGAEDCNGVDDDCDGVVDNWSPPADYCGRFGVCAGVAVECRDPDGAGPLPAAPFCDYPPTHEEDETRCDGEDNDCDGLIDEGYEVGAGTVCSVGHGACTATGHYVCDPANDQATICSIDVPGGDPSPELCDGLDNDCNGVVDDNISLANHNVVEITADVDLNYDGVIGGDEANRHYYMFQYEASHPDATAGELGQDWTYACSSSDVLPWIGVAWRDAQAACCGLNDGRSCAYQQGAVSDPSDPSGTVQMWMPLGWALCTAQDWEVSCQGGDQPLDPIPPGTPYVYPYDDDYSPGSCNDELNGVGAAEPTGSMTSCRGTQWIGDHLDMSGNVAEWTWTGWFVCGCDNESWCEAGCDCDPDCGCACDTDSAGDRAMGAARCDWDDAAGDYCACDPDCNTYYEYRGGGFRSLAEATTCQFDFNVGADRSDEPPGGGDPAPGLALETLGFRCCYYPAL